MKHIISLLLLSCLYGCNTSPAIKTGLEGKEMPSFNLLLMDSVHQISTSEIPEGQSTVFLLFCPKLSLLPCTNAGDH